MPAGRASTIWGGGRLASRGCIENAREETGGLAQDKACLLRAQSPAVSLGFRLGGVHCGTKLAQSPCSHSRALSFTSGRARLDLPRKEPITRSGDVASWEKGQGR